MNTSKSFTRYMLLLSFFTATSFFIGEQLVADFNKSTQAVVLAGISAVAFGAPFFLYSETLYKVYHDETAFRAKFKRGISSFFSDYRRVRLFGFIVMVCGVLFIMTGIITSILRMFSAL